MGFDYLEGKNWKDITRDERYYCAELFFVIRNDVKEFVIWLRDKAPELGISDEEINEEWEIGYEVCFYRDYLKMKEQLIRESDFSQKRTFDLCLFSNNRIIIIEAKAQSGFGTNQNKEFKKDLTDIHNLLGPNIKVDVVALASSKYFKNKEKRGGLDSLFKGAFSWDDIFQSYCRQSVFKYADEVYKN